MTCLLYLATLLTPCVAQFGGLFDQIFGNQMHHQQQHRQQQDSIKVNNPVENTYIDMSCDKYLCEDTLTCVPTPQDCPCQYPDSQIKCEFPNKQGYVCISQPSNDENPDCDYVTKAMQGLI